MSKQKTISKPVSFSGIGLHTGSLTTVTFKPAPENSGITFFRVDIKDSPPIPANIDYVVDVSRGTTIGIGEAKVHTVEHALAAYFGWLLRCHAEPGTGAARAAACGRVFEAWARR